MSQAEHDAMKASGTVQESMSGTTHVANPADASAFINQAKPGSMYVEFNVQTSSLKATNEGWAKIIGSTHLKGGSRPEKECQFHKYRKQRTSFTRPPNFHERRDHAEHLHWLGKANRRKGTQQ